MELFAGFVQLFSGKKATTLKSTDLVVYPVHVILLNFSTRRRQRLISNEYMLVVILPECYSDEQLEGEGRGDDE